MKKILTLFFSLVCGLFVSAQTPLTTAADFTGTDCHGNEVHLFDILDRGQYVILDFFYYDCSYCRQTVPNIVQAYSLLGCNQGDVFFMEVSPYDDDATLHTWTSTYGVEYPTIGTSSTGASIINTYQVSYFPTVILIAPDRTILNNDIYPIGSSSVITNLLHTYGVEQQSCNTGIHETAATGSEFSMYPNPADAQLTITGDLHQVAIYNTIGQEVLSQEVNTNKLTLSTAKLENGVYFVRVNGETARKLVIAH